MKCARFCEIISTFVDAEATALEQLALQEHLKSCVHCKNELISQYMLKDMLKEYRSKFYHNAEIQVSADVMSRIMFPERGKVENAPWFSFSKYSWWAVMAFVVALTVATVFSAHVDSAKMVASSMDNDMREYASYIYEHVNDADDTASAPKNIQYKQVSFIK